jgi:hypothetical protein
MKPFSIPIFSLGILTVSSGWAAQFFPRETRFVYKIPGCQPGHFFNCSQILKFGPDGTVLAVFTDIMNAGNYEIIDHKIIAKFDPDRGDSPAEVPFSILSDSSIRNDLDGHVFKKVGSESDETPSAMPAPRGVR